MEHTSCSSQAPEQPVTSPDSYVEEQVTEQSNRLSTNIDVASPTEIASILYACDQEIFTGWESSKGLNDKLVQEKIEKIALKIAEVIQKPSGTVVFSGCGTSGRLSFFTAQTFNKYMKFLNQREVFQYLIAGGNRALFRSVELAEDDPATGVQTLKMVTDGKDAVLFVGVTCGLSAPYVGGQLDFCLSQLDKFFPVLIGFNPAHQARNIRTRKWNKTFLQVVQEMEAAEQASQAFILNPVIGPEPITGSSRMKCGTATKILLELLSLVAINNYPCYFIPKLISMYESACHQVYKQTELLGSLIQLAGSCLVAGGHIYYLGKDEFGLMAVIDASECPPTFGASFQDVRGFVSGDFNFSWDKDGSSSEMGQEYRISVTDFEENILPNIKSNDLIVLLDKDQFDKFQAALTTASCHKVAIFLTLNDEQPSPEFHICDAVFVINLKIPILESWTPDSAKVMLRELMLQICLKWTVNGLSTGAHIIKGKVYQNTMIDVRVSNMKLFHRALGIIQKYCGLTQEDALEYLLKSIYSTDSLSDEQRSLQITDHILAASQREKVVPMAMLLASLRCPVKKAVSMMDQEPTIRKLFHTQKSWSR